MAKQICVLLVFLDRKLIRSSLEKSFFLLSFKFTKKALITSFIVMDWMSLNYILPKRSVKIHFLGLKSASNKIVSIILILIYLSFCLSPSC